MTREDVGRWLERDVSAPEHRVYDNVFQPVFDDDGRCSDFSEVYLRR